MLTSGPQTPSPSLRPWASEMTLSEPYLKNTLIFVVTERSDAKGLRDLKGKTIRKPRSAFYKTFGSL